MGAPTTQPFGNNCISCNNLLWLPGETPSRIFVTYSGIIATHEIEDYPHGPGNGQWLYCQNPNPISACQFILNSDTWVGVVNFYSMMTQIYLVDPDGRYHFQNFSADPCVTSMDTTQNDPDNWAFNGGQALITW